MLAHPGSSIFMVWPSKVPLRGEEGRISQGGKGKSQPRLTKASSVRRARRGRPSARDARSRVANAPWRVSAFQRRSGGAFRLLRSLFDTRRGALVPRRGGRVGGHGFTLRRAFPSKNKHPLLDISYPPLRPSRRAQRCGDPYAPRVRPPRDPDLRAGAALVDCAIEERGSLDTRSRKGYLTALNDSSRRRLFLRLQETRREFSAGRPSSLAPPQRLAPGTSARARWPPRRARVGGRALRIARGVA